MPLLRSLQAEMEKAATAEIPPNPIGSRLEGFCLSASQARQLRFGTSLVYYRNRKKKLKFELASMRRKMGCLIRTFPSSDSCTLLHTEYCPSTPGSESRR